MSKKRNYERRAPKGPPPVCSRCKTAEDVAPATNYGVPTGRWWCRGCGAHVETAETDEATKGAK